MLEVSHFNVVYIDDSDNEGDIKMRKYSLEFCG